MLRALAVVIFSLAGAALAEDTPPVARVTLLASGGAWDLYRGDYPFLTEQGAEFIPDSCFATAGNEAASMTFATFPSVVREIQPEVFGTVFLQISADAFKFRRRTGEVTIGDGNYNLTIKGELYRDQTIMANLGGGGRPPWEFELGARTWEGRITVTDDRGRSLASFPASGIRTIYPRFLSCARLPSAKPS